jgi:hypothetical protein
VGMGVGVGPPPPPPPFGMAAGAAPAVLASSEEVAEGPGDKMDVDRKEG